MTTASSSIRSAAPRPGIANAARTGAEPGRAGALRLALAVAALTALAGAAVWFGTCWFVERDALAHLDGLSDLARRDLEELVDTRRAQTQSLATDPRIVEAVSSFEAGVRATARELAGRPPAALENYAKRLSAHYRDEVLPRARAAGRSADLEGLDPLENAPEFVSSTVVLQSIYLAGEGRAPGTPALAYHEAHDRLHGALADRVDRDGWANLHLVDQEAGTIVYSTSPGIETFTRLTDGAHRRGAIARSVQRADAEASPGEVFLADGRAGPTDDTAKIFFSAPVFAEKRRIGTLVTSIGPDLIGKALLPGAGESRWTRADLGGGGQVLAFAADGTLRSTPRRAAPGLDRGSDGLRQALAGTPASGAFDVGGETLLASYAPLDLGGRRWVVAAERPRREVLAPLYRLAPVLLGIVALAGVVGWVLGGRLWSQYAGQFRQITSILQRAQRGDQKARLDAARPGAVGALAASINRLLDDRAGVLERAEEDRDKLARDAQCLVDVARRAASGEVPPSAALAGSALGNVSIALDQMLGTMRELSGGLHAASSQFGTSADRIRSSADETSARAAEQSRACQQTRGSADELLAGSGRIPEKCGEALDVARRSSQAVRLGQTAVADLLSGMEGLQRETRAATVKIKRLGERSMQISAIIGTISKMSAHTDMLALNAAIEASRAGEQGQGFTLVADEVRKLAERAAAAAKEIERLIGGIQSDIGEAVDGMKRQGERIDVQAAAASEAQHALERVGNVTGDATATMEEIARAATEQVDAIGDLRESITQIATAATDVQRASEQTRQTSIELSHLSRELLSRVEPSPEG